MKTAIYSIQYSNCKEQPKCFIQHRPALACFNREASRLRKGDVSWGSVRLVKWEATGTPRSVASAMVEIGSAISGGIPIRQINNQAIVQMAKIESWILQEQVSILA